MEYSGSLAKRVGIVAGIVFVVIYAGDYGLLQYKMRGNSGLGTVTSYYGTPTKDGKMEIFTDQPQIETCVHSLFPHLGYRPCWYANRNNVTQVGRLSYRRTFRFSACDPAASSPTLVHVGWFFLRRLRQKGLVTARTAYRKNKRAGLSIPPFFVRTTVSVPPSIGWPPINRQLPPFPDG